MVMIKYRGQRSLMEGVGSVGFEDSAVSPVASSRASPENGKSDLAVTELVGSGPSDFVLGVEDGSPDDRNGVRRGSVVSGHFCVELTDGSVEGDISVLLVHVVVSGSGLIPQDYSEGLNMAGSSLEDLVDC
jgi:hypothetical protein